VFHNFYDEKAVECLRAAIPALKTGARILINDESLSEPGKVRWWNERASRYVCHSAEFLTLTNNLEEVSMQL
jgi:hypothetical protein